MKRTLLAAILAALVSGAIAALATVVVPNPQTCQVPGTCLDLATVASGIPGINLSWSSGTGAASVSATAGNAVIVPRSVTFDNITASATGTFTCGTNPVLNLVNCGTSATCASPTTIGSSGTVTAAGTFFPGTITAANALVAAGNYVAWTVSPGACTVVTLYGNAVGH